MRDSGTLGTAGTFGTAGTLDRRVAISAASYPCPEGFSPERWERLREGATRFAAEWADKALSLGWSEDDLFVVAQPFANVSLQGAAWFVGNSTVTAVTGDAITLRTTSGSVSRIYRESARVPTRPYWLASSPALTKAVSKLDAQESGTMPLVISCSGLCATSTRTIASRLDREALYPFLDRTLGATR